MLFLATLLQAPSVSGSDELRLASNGPVSLQEANNARLGIPLPNSASEIEYDLCVGGLQRMSLFVRFRVSPREADEAIQAIIDQNNRMMSRSLPYTKAALPVASNEAEGAETKSPAEPERKAPVWWKADEILSGYMRSELAPYAPTILYDQKEAYIYLYQID